MSLDAAPSDDMLRQMAAERMAQRNGVSAGPDSPLRSKGERERPPATRRHKKLQIDTYRLEHDEQCALFRWIDANAPAMPDLAKAFAIPNGGLRTLRTASMLKAEGVKPGIPDVMLLVPRDGYHGLMIEMKRPTGTLSPSQIDWQFAFSKDGYRVKLATTWEMARDHILEYLGLPRS